ncbi:MAG: hypothetical protein WCN88_01120 [Candidatus Falkowbacteria bacterium]
MPRVKKNTDLSPEKKIVKKSKTKIKIKSPEKKAAPKKKARPVVIDVIEDDEPEISFPELKKEAIGSFAPDESSEEDDEEEAPVEIDQQKKFFSELVTEIKEKNPKTASIRRTNGDEELEDEPRARKSVSLYRRLVWRFIAFTVILLLVVFYFSFSKLTIYISPKGETINDNLLLKVGPVESAGENSETDFREQVAGTAKEVSVTDEKSFPATGEEFTGEEISGQVSIINNSAKSQALVATTRILSPDGKLFRIKDAVNVPAGVEVNVDIYAEKPSEDLAIAATTFTIPGLWLGLQDKIYAKSKTDFVFRQKIKKYIKASDIEQATKDMNDLLVAKAKISVDSTSTNAETLYESLDTASFEIDAKAGETKDSFTIKAKGSLAIVSFSKDEAAKLASAKLALLVPDDKELVDYSADNISYTFDNYDTKTGVASVKASFSGTMVLKSDTQIIDKKQLVNLNRQQLENYLKSFPEIKNYEFKFFPSFINRAPRLPERIQIEVKGLEK